MRVEAPAAPELPCEEDSSGQWNGYHEEQPQLAVDEETCVGAVRVEEYHAEEGLETWRDMTH